MEFINDNNLGRVLNDDGVDHVILKKYENLPSVKLEDLKNEMGAPPWGIRLVYNESFGGVLICQKPGEGNRLHYHPDADECWVILEGEWEWYIEGIGTRTVMKDDIVVVQKGTPHKIKCVGEHPGIRLAITKPDVTHTYKEDEY